MKEVEKSGLHPRNRHRSRYDFKSLISVTPKLGEYVRLNEYNDESIDFSNPDAVKALNQALLSFFYGVKFWDIPKNFLCPPIPGRADYIHNIADLFENSKNLKGLDIGVGANCVYPLIGKAEYDWEFVGADINPVSIESAQKIITENNLSSQITLRKQTSPSHIFKNIIRPDDKFDFTMCNPPFHSSAEDAVSGSKRKWKNLGKEKTQTVTLNFGGQGAELWCQGGELSFIKLMIEESVLFSKNCQWFTTLVSKKDNLENIYRAMTKVKAHDVRTIEMGQGQKKSRLVAWTFNKE